MNYSKFLDFDYVYKRIYLTRLIIFLLILYGGVVFYGYYTNQNIMDGILLTTGLLIFIIICGKIGELLKWKSIW